MKHFYTLHHVTDRTIPTLSKEFRMMSRATDGRVNNFVKHDKVELLPNDLSLKCEDLDFQQTFDLLETHAISKRGSNKAILWLLELLTDKVEITDIDEALMIVNTIFEL